MTLISKVLTLSGLALTYHNGGSGSTFVGRIAKLDADPFWTNNAVYSASITSGGGNGWVIPNPACQTNGTGVLDILLLNNGSPSSTFSGTIRIMKYEP
jgi:hypothetical protein